MLTERKQASVAGKRSYSKYSRKTSDMMVRNGSGTLSRAKLEGLCQKSAQRLAMIYGLHSPDFFDNALFQDFIRTLRAREVITKNEAGFLEFGDGKGLFGKATAGDRTEKEKVFAEIARVLKPGGRFSVSDIVAEDLPQAVVEHAAPEASSDEFLIQLALGSRLPIIIQGLGARSKVDAPTATPTPVPGTATPTPTPRRSWPPSSP